MKKNQPPKNTPVLRLVPSGAKLSELAATLNAVGVVVTALSDELLNRDPTARERILFNLDAIFKLAPLSRDQHEAYKRAIEFFSGNRP